MQKIIYKYIVTSSILFLLLSSCGRIFLGADTEATPMAVFDNLAHNIETRYSLLGDKEIDWQSITKKYRTKIDPEMTDDSLFQVLNGLLGELKDGHVNIRTAVDHSRNWSWKLDYPVNFNMNIVERNYLGRHHKRTQNFLNTIIDSVGYVYYGSFAPTISRKSLNILIKSMEENTKGLIFDIRSNGGGQLVNCQLLASYFADSTNNCMAFHYKSGPGAGDFEGPIMYEIKAVDDSLRYTKPVIVLMNRGSYSGGTFFPAMMSAYPQVTLMGDTSGGGGGVPWHYDLLNGWDYRYSTTRTIDCQGKNIEFGVEPDIKVDLDPADEAKGIDTIIERALAELR